LQKTVGQTDEEGIHVSISGITAAQAATYYERLDDYYAKQLPGQWFGKGAESLGITGGVNREEFINLLHGRSPDGDELIQTASNGEHRAGLDLTFSAPKSISILNIFREEFREAHLKAVISTLDYVQKNFIQARETHDGVTEKVNTGNLVAALYEHTLSRQEDPQLHTHAVIMNATERNDGQWRAITNESLFDNKMLIGQVYRNELARIITQEMGYSIISDSKGLFEIKGIEK